MQRLMSRPFIPKSKIPTVADVGLQFSINGQVKQAGTAKDMIFGVPKLISFVSSIMRLEVSHYNWSGLIGRRET
jgi:2-keto-4-pentenoate hydratase/2-oxohepta-3-ene-1,7-dioic acid hydratase in catechol pathway